MKKWKLLEGGQADQLFIYCLLCRDGEDIIFLYILNIYMGGGDGVRNDRRCAQMNKWTIPRRLAHAQCGKRKRGRLLKKLTQTWKMQDYHAFLIVLEVNIHNYLNYNGERLKWTAICPMFCFVNNKKRAINKSEILTCFEDGGRGLAIFNMEYSEAVLLLIL